METPQVEQKEEIKSYKIKEGLFTNEEQTKAVDFLMSFILESDDKEAVLIGKGGTGKTTSIKVVTDKLETLKKYNKKTGKQEGFVVYAAAPSHSACNKLAESLDYKIPVYTYASLLGMKLDIYSGKFVIDEFSRREKGIPIERCNIVVLDEGSMMGEKLKGYFTSLTDDDTKIIYMGDYRQLPPIREKKENLDMDADSPVFTLKNRVEIHQRMRQANESPIIPVIDFVGDCIETGQFKRFPKENRVSKKVEDSEIVFTNEAEWFLNDYCRSFLEDPTNPYHTKGIAYTNDYRKKVNNAIRKKLYKEECINQFVKGEIVTAFETFFISISESIKNAESFIVTDIVKGEVEFEYTEMVAKDGQFLSFPEFKTEKFKVLKLDLEYKDQIYYNVPVIAEEDRNKYDKLLQHLFDKRMFREAYSLKETFADLQYGYVITSHKAQGHTYDDVYVLEDDIMALPNVSIKTKFKSFYVAVSRPSKRLVIFSRF